MTVLINADNNRELSPGSASILDKRYVPRGESAGGGLPPWITGTTSTWRAPAFNRESPSMLIAREVIASALHGSATREVCVIGDSKSRSTPDPFGNPLPWPEQWRRILDAREGFVQADADARWTFTRMTRMDEDGIGVGPTTPGGADAKTASFASSEPFTGGTLLLYVTGGGSVTVTIDGTPQAVTVPAGDAWHQVPLGALSNATHTIGASATGDLYVAGVVLTYTGAVLRITNGARSGTDAADWSVTGFNKRWATVVDGPATTPALFISALGTNSWTDFAALTTYYNALAALDIPVIMVAPGGLGGGNATRAQVMALANHLYSIAQAHDWPLIDFEQVIGEYTVAEAHALMYDTVHENERGGLLQAITMHDELGS